MFSLPQTLCSEGWIHLMSLRGTHWGCTGGLFVLHSYACRLLFCTLIPALWQFKFYDHFQFASNSAFLPLRESEAGCPCRHFLWRFLLFSLSAGCQVFWCSEHWILCFGRERAELGSDSRRTRAQLCSLRECVPKKSSDNAVVGTNTLRALQDLWDILPLEGVKLHL